MDILEVLNSEVVQGVVERASEAIEGLGDGASFVADVYVRQQVVSGVQYLVLGLLSLTFFLVNIGVFLKGKKKRSWSYTNDPMVLYMVGMFLFAIFGVMLSMGISYLVNPEYYAIQEVLRVLTKGAN